MTAALCQLLAEFSGDMPQDGMLWEEKRDGWRCLRFAGLDNKPRLWTRQGWPMEGAAHIAHQLDKMERAAGEPYFFDGEIQVGTTLAETKHWLEAGWKRGGEAGTLYLFDAMPLADWKRGGCDVPLYKRKERMAELARAAEADDWTWRAGSRGRDEGRNPIVVIEGEWCANTSDALDMARRIWAAGGEGIVLKQFDAPYRRARNASWQKMKPGGPWQRKLAPIRIYA